MFLDLPAAVLCLMSFRKLLFWIHLAAGSVAGIVILIMSVSGVLLAFERQINRWADHPARIQSAAPRLPLAPLAASVASPNGQLPSITVRSDRSAPLEFAFGRERTVYVDPANGHVLGEVSGRSRSFFSALERIHRSLGTDMRAGFGRPITGACNFAFLFLVVSGFYLWLPKKWSAQHVRPAIWFKSGFRARARALNWHKVIGFWCAVPLFLIVLSGVIMSYSWANNLLYRATGNEPPAQGNGPRDGGRRDSDSNQDHSPRADRLLASEFKSLDDLLSTAEQRIPAWRSITFRIPTPQSRSLVLSIDEGNGGQPQKRSQLTLNRTSGEIARAETFDSYNSGRRLRSIARFLHTGEILGLPGQIVAAIASLGGVLLVYTGLSLAIRRLLGRLRRSARISPAAETREIALTR